MSASQSNSNKTSGPSLSLNILTQEQKKQHHSGVSQRSQPQPTKNNDISSNTTKFINSFRKFTLEPSKKDCYIVLTRALRSTHFRVSVIDKKDCYISQDTTFDSVKYSGFTNINMRSDLITALSSPDNNEYIIEEINHYKNKNDINSDIKSKELKIMKTAGGMKVIMAVIRVYKSKTEGKNIDYLFGKISETLAYKQKENESLLRDNANWHKKYNKSLLIIDESINAKNKQEQELMSKFVLILNEKKKQIRALQNELQRLKCINPNPKQRKQVRIRSCDNNNDNVDDGVLIENNKKGNMDDVIDDIHDMKVDNDRDGHHMLALPVDPDPDLDMDMNMELDLSLAEVESLSPTFGVGATANLATKSNKKTKSKSDKNKRRNKNKSQKELNVIDDGSLNIGNSFNNNNRKRKRNVLVVSDNDDINFNDDDNEYDDDGFKVPSTSPKNKRRRISDNTNNKQKKQRRKSNASDASDDLNSLI